MAIDSLPQSLHDVHLELGEEETSSLCSYYCVMLIMFLPTHSQFKFESQVHFELEVERVLKFHMRITLFVLTRLCPSRHAKI